jgi:hypothetical protein
MVACEVRAGSKPVTTGNGSGLRNNNRFMICAWHGPFKSSNSSPVSGGQQNLGLCERYCALCLPRVYGCICGAQIPIFGTSPESTDTLFWNPAYLTIAGLAGK